MQIKINNTNKTVNKDIEELAKKDLSIEELLIFATEHNCSDLYIKAFEQPYISRYGKIIKLPCKAISKDDWAIFYTKYILHEFNAEYVRKKLLDTSISIRIPDDSPNFNKYIENYYRYRVSFGFSEENNIATFRMIKPDQPTFETINYNPICVKALEKAYSKPTGICIETGPTGSGKSTTLAACINTFTQPGSLLDNKVIITLEDPIENLFSSTESVKINQKELGKDFISFDLGIKAALREHPNMIIVGEMRDKEVIGAAVEAGRTGHIVSSTFHASNVGGTISRLMYHLNNDKNLAYDLIMQINIIISQRMMKRDDKYVVDTQFLVFTPEVVKFLLELIENPELNIANEVNRLVQMPFLQERGISKDWDYKDDNEKPDMELFELMKQFRAGEAIDIPIDNIDDETIEEKLAK